MDINGVASAWLRDMAAVQSSKQRGWGYKRAAAAIWELDQPIDRLRAPDGSLPAIPYVGPSSTRILIEVLETGQSAIVARAVAASGRDADVERRRRLREHFLSRAEVLRVLSQRGKGVSARRYRGDLQMHSEWSDGVASIADLAEACLARGYQYCAVTDHSHGLPIAGGMTPQEVVSQHREVDELNERLDGRFRVLKGIEANILADGDLDLVSDERAAFDIVLAAPHSKLRQTDDQTSRLLAAVSAPGVHVLAHGRGRMLGSRAGIIAHWDQVFARAVDRDVAIEIDGDPSRQDLDHVLARQAFDAGCIFALDSDAHGPAQLHYADTALAHARLAGIPPERIINCWDLDRLMSWLERRG